MRPVEFYDGCRNRSTQRLCGGVVAAESLRGFVGARVQRIWNVRESGVRPDPVGSLGCARAPSVTTSRRPNRDPYRGSISSTARAESVWRKL